MHINNITLIKLTGKYRKLLSVSCTKATNNRNYPRGEDIVRASVMISRELNSINSGFLHPNICCNVIAKHISINVDLQLTELNVYV